MNDPATFRHWEPALVDLCGRIQSATRSRLLGAAREEAWAELSRHAGLGAGDVTFGLDVPAEEAIAAWLGEQAARAPLSLLSEDTGWRHLGPDAGGGVRELPGPDHGGPRLVIDPIDGTRPLMHDLRSAWTALAFCGPGPTLPRQGDVSGAVLSELPTTLAGAARRLVSDGETTHLDTLPLEGLVVEGGSLDGVCPSERLLRNDHDDRPDHGLSSFFRYEPRLRPTLARLEAQFYARLVEHEGADPRSFYEDQYCSNAGQLALVATGTYRFVVDARAHLARLRGESTTTSKPYDVAAAILVAQGAGAVVTAVDGTELDFPLDATTPVDFVAWANPGTRDRLAPHLAAALAEWAASERSDP